MRQARAHRPPRADSKTEAVAAVAAEFLLLAGVAGFLVRGLRGMGVLPDPEQYVWTSVIGGPISRGTAVATYWGADRPMARGDWETGPDGGWIRLGEPNFMPWS